MPAWDLGPCLHPLPSTSCASEITIPPGQAWLPTPQLSPPLEDGVLCSRRLGLIGFLGKNLQGSLRQWRFLLVTCEKAKVRSQPGSMQTDPAQGPQKEDGPDSRPVGLASA